MVAEIRAHLFDDFWTGHHFRHLCHEFGRVEKAGHLISAEVVLGESGMTHSIRVVQVVYTFHIGKGVEAGQALYVSLHRPASEFNTYVMSFQIIQRVRTHVETGPHLW